MSILHITIELAMGLALAFAVFVLIDTVSDIINYISKGK